MNDCGTKRGYRQRIRREVLPRVQLLSIVVGAPTIVLRNDSRWTLCDNLPWIRIKSSVFLPLACLEAVLLIHMRIPPFAGYPGQNGDLLFFVKYLFLYLCPQLGYCHRVHHQDWDMGDVCLCTFVIFIFRRLCG